jgi:hypothetical protein
VQFNRVPLAPATGNLPLRQIASSAPEPLWPAPAPKQPD